MVSGVAVGRVTRGRGPRLALIAILAIYGFVCLLDPAEFRFLDNLDLAIHEAGHVLLSPFGEFVHLVGGTLFQLLVPALFVWHFTRRRDHYAAAVPLWWVGQNLWNISVYVKDAQTQELPLVGGGEHDWAYLLDAVGLIVHDQTIGSIVYVLGIVVFMASIFRGVAYADHQGPPPAEAPGERL